jgi:uncharacterized membrane protein YoaK (UPF0700 family)
MSYLALGHVFTANPTDNTVLVAIWGGRRNATGALPRCWPYSGCAWAATGTALSRGRATGWRVRTNRALLPEVALLGAAVRIFAWLAMRVSRRPGHAA